MSKVLRLSYFINENTPLYGGKKALIEINKMSSIMDGDTANTTSISLPIHAGTHIDFPKHFSNNGKSSSDYPPNFWISKKIGYIECEVEKLPSHLNEIPSNIEILILKTGFGSYRTCEKYWKSQPVIPSEFGTLLKKKFPHLKIFGFDMISLTSKLDRSEGKKAHESFLLDNNILLLEDMNLSEINAKPSSIIIAPLLISNCDGAPCTVFAYT